MLSSSEEKKEINIIPFLLKKNISFNIKKFTINNSLSTKMIFQSEKLLKKKINLKLINKKGDKFSSEIFYWKPLIEKTDSFEEAVKLTKTGYFL